MYVLGHTWHHEQLNYFEVYISAYRHQLQQQAWSSGYDFCLTTRVFGCTEGSEFDSQGL
jgi:hypothetical protein